MHIDNVGDILIATVKISISNVKANLNIMALKTFSLTVFHFV